MKEETSSGAEAGVPEAGVPEAVFRRVRQGRASASKIARLPAAVREELNRRMEEGESAATMLEWINGLPEVREMVRERFAGQPINEYNITRWRYSGYAGWVERRKTMEAAAAMAASCAGMSRETHEKLLHGISLVMTAGLVEELRKFEAMPDGEERSRAGKELYWKLVNLRRGNFYAGKLRLERERLRLSPEAQAAKAAQAKKRQPKLSPEEKQRRIRKIFGTE